MTDKGYDFNNIPGVGGDNTDVDKLATQKKESVLKNVKMPSIDLKKPSFNLNIKDIFYKFRYPIGLMFVWLAITIIFNTCFDNPVNNKLISVMAIHGNVSVNNIFSHFINLSSYSGISLNIALILFIFFSVLDSFISLFLSGFVHITYSHLFSNIFLFLVIMIYVYVFELGSMKNNIKRWFKFNVQILGLIWLVFEVIGWASLLFVNKSSNIFSLFVKNNTPIVGASVGLLALYGFIFIVLYKRTRLQASSFFNKGALVLLGVIILPIILEQLSNLSRITHIFDTSSSLLSITIFVAIAHLLGLFLGVLSGIRCKV